MTAIPFWKVESIGNDFVLVHLDDVETLSGCESADTFLQNLAIKVCARRFGVGSDGLLAVGMAGEMLIDRMFNPDGTEDFCGNGIRCAFDHALRQGWVQPDKMAVEHLGRTISGSAVDMRLQSVLPEHYQITFELPPASYLPADIPMIRESEAFDTALFRINGEVYSGSVLSTGTAHTILPVNRLPGDEEFFRVSPQIETHPMFPERTSVMWVDEPKQGSTIHLRIWERGVGETQGCGTGSTAAAVDFLRRKGGSGSVQVVNPGGTLTVAAKSWDSPTAVTGFALEVFTGDFRMSPGLDTPATSANSG